MLCPFCQQEMRSIDNGKFAPRLRMVWICKNCIHEVRAAAEQNVETQVWVINDISIFVFYNDKEYCLHQDYLKHQFELIEVNDYSDGNIFRTTTMPINLTPTNALEKLKIYLLFR